MRTWSVRLGLSLMVTVGFWGTGLPAQEVHIAPPGENVFVVPVVPYEPLHHPPLPLPLPEYGPRTARHRLQTHFNESGVCCQSNAPWGACSNLQYEWRFVFGSCRTFFNEKCEPLHGVHDRQR